MVDVLGLRADEDEFVMNRGALGARDLRLRVLGEHSEALHRRPCLHKDDGVLERDDQAVVRFRLCCAVHSTKSREGN